MESKSLQGVPKWDRKQNSARMYISKLEALLEYHDSGEAMYRVAMQNFPTQTEYDALGMVDIWHINHVSLYYQNKWECAMMVLV